MEAPVPTVPLTPGPRRRLRWILLTVLAVLVGVVVWQTTSARIHPRAVWVWSDRMMRDTLAGDSLFAWARRHRIDRFYQHVEPLLLEDPDAVAAFLRRARTRGFTVEALLGDPAWLAAPDSALARVDRLLSLHNRLGTDTLAAMHLDVEPYALPEWRQREAVLVTAFQVLIERVQRRRASRTLPLHVDIPLWYDAVRDPGDTTGSLLAWLMPRVEGVTVMAYATDPQTLWPALARETASARREGTALAIGVETSCGVGVDVSFCTLGRTRLERMLATVERRLGDDAVWGGTAIHFYPDAVRLLP